MPDDVLEVDDVAGDLDDGENNPDTADDDSYQGTQPLCLLLLEQTVSLFSMLS